MEKFLNHRVIYRVSCTHHLLVGLITHVTPQKHVIIDGASVFRCADVEVIEDLGNQSADKPAEPGLFERMRAAVA